MKNKLVTVIMPAFNAEKFICIAIESVLGQTYENLELIIINDGSIDVTKNLIQRYCEQDKRVFCIDNTQNLGVAETRNVGIKNAKGCYIAFLDADDVWYNSKLENQINLMIKTAVNVVYSSYIFIDENSKSYAEFVAPSKITYQTLLKTNSIGNLTGIYNAESIGKFYQKNLPHEDYLMWLEILQNERYALSTCSFEACYRVHNKSVSHNKFKAFMWQWNIYNKELKINLFGSAVLMIFYVINGIKKHRKNIWR